MNKSEIKSYLKLNWGKKDLLEIQEDLNIDMYSLLQKAFESNLQKIKTENMRRRWIEGEDNFLKDNSNCLSIDEACNLLYRSRYATYQRIKLLNLNEMIGKRNTKR